MKCNFCFKNEVLKDKMLHDKLIGTLFICKECLDKNEFKFNII